jgi:L-lactate dehydrogenase
MRKCAIIGCGNVGATTAYALLQSGLFSELLLLDINKERAVGEAEDLAHAMPFLSPAEVRAADYPELTDTGLIIIAAGAAQRVGETRLDLVRKNTEIFRSIVESICRYNSDALLLVVTNPVDILTEVTRRLSGFPAHRVIGSGTVLDTARLKHLLGRHLCVDPRQVHAFIIGEHGDSELPVFSSANISGIDLDHFCGGGCRECSGGDLDRLFTLARDAAYRIIRAKGSTYYAIAEAVRRIVTAIVRDESAILPISVHTGGMYGIEGLSMSLPAMLGASGVERMLEIPLSVEEKEALLRSAAQLRSVLHSVL